MNPIFKLLQSLPTNGWTTAIAGIGAILYGVGGLIIGQIEVEMATGFILGGLATLGIGNKLEKSKQ